MPNHARCWQEAMAKFGLKMTAADVYATEGMRGVETIRRDFCRRYRLCPQYPYFLSPVCAGAAALRMEIHPLAHPSACGW